ncbi:MAG: hypothetical protein IJ036_00010 [Lachnospiraceae bacterium]|nr:hypothetical protein [Lachnospiraceae bacterium]
MRERLLCGFFCVAVVIIVIAGFFYIGNMVIDIRDARIREEVSDERKALEESEFKEATLEINGNLVDCSNVTVNAIWAHVPFCEVIKGLGGVVEWKDDETAKIVLLDKEYVLSMSDEVTLKREGWGDDNHMHSGVGYGSEMFCKKIERDVIVDGLTLEMTLHNMGVQVVVYKSYEEQVVSIYIDEE